MEGSRMREKGTDEPKAHGTVDQSRFWQSYSNIQYTGPRREFYYRMNAQTFTTGSLKWLLLVLLDWLHQQAREKSLFRTLISRDLWKKL